MKQEKGNKAQWVNQVKIEFSTKPITAWGGLCSLIGKYLERLGFRNWVEENIPIGESSNNAGGIYEKVLAQFLTMLVGGERFSHLSWWGHGIEAVKETFGVKWLPKSSSTLTRFWSKINREWISEKLSDSGRGFARTIVGWEGIKEDTLNLDSSVLVRYGKQEGAKRGYNPKKPGRPSHHPLLAFLGSGYTVNVWNRSGDTFSGQGAKDFFEQSVKSMGSGFKVKRVLCDSGFYLVRFIEYLEKEGYTYIIAVPMSQILQRRIERLHTWKEIDKGIEVGEFAFEHLDDKWTRPRRYVVVRQEIAKRPTASGKQPSLFKDLEEWKDYRLSAMITNDENSLPEEVWRGYRSRANDENVIKDFDKGYGFGTFNLRSFWATEAVMVMNVLVFHNMIHYLNRTVLNVNKPQNHLKTLRNKYFILPAQLGSSGRYAVLRIGVKDRSLRGQIRYFLEKISLIPYQFNRNAVDT